jgi:hypothetical protein
MIAAAQQTGIFPNIARSVYESWPGINFSRLKHFQHPPAKARYLLAHPPPPTEAMELGTALHLAILEPDRFGEDYVCAPHADRRSKEGKQTWAAFEEANPDKLILARADYEACLAMRDAIWAADSDARAILQAQPGWNELSFTWTDGETGLAAKARCDRMARWNMAGTVVMDVKTARSAAEAEFARDVARFHYAGQAAYYLDGLASLAPAPRRWLWLVIEKDPPYLHQLFEPEDRLMEQGRRSYRRWLAAYKLATETDQWPGYPNGISPIDVPRWEQEELDGSL